MRPAAETEQAFADFEQFVRFIKGPRRRAVRHRHRAGTLYADRALGRDFGRADLLAIARAVQKDFDFVKSDGMPCQGADMFALLTDAAAGGRTKAFRPRSVDDDRWTGADVQSIDGPVAFFQLQLGRLRERGSRHRRLLPPAHRRMPDEVWIGAENLSPVDYLATLGSVVEQF